MGTLLSRLLDSCPQPSATITVDRLIHVTVGANHILCTFSSPRSREFGKAEVGPSSLALLPRTLGLLRPKAQSPTLFLFFSEEAKVMPTVQTTLQLTQAEAANAAVAARYPIRIPTRRHPDQRQKAEF